jgi:hypothetical protein
MSINKIEEQLPNSWKKNKQQITTGSDCGKVATSGGIVNASGQERSLQWQQ